MSNIWIKICGITQPQDARAAAALGVDAIGLNFCKDSPRVVTTTQAAAILDDLAPVLQVYALFVNQTEAEVRAALAIPGIRYLQFHGNEPESFCAKFGVPYMKAVRVRDAASALEEIQHYPSAARILLDSYHAKIAGGTGKTFDWGQAVTIANSSQNNIVLAGGLNSENIANAIQMINPFGVDVSSGVEAAPGIKDLRKLKSFVKGVRSVRK